MKKRVKGSKSKISSSDRFSAWITFIVCSLLLFDLLYIYFTKYTRKNLSVFEFNMESIGNILNFVSFIIPVAGLIILLFRNRPDQGRYYRILIITLLMNIPLILAAFFKQIRFPMPLEHLFGFPLGRVYVGLFYSAYQIILIFLGFAVWMMVFGLDKKIYLMSFLYTGIMIFILSIWAFIYTNNDFDDGTLYLKNGKRADVAVILGAAVWSKTKASPVFASRIGKACNLYNTGIVKKIQVTGGNAPGELTEAEVAYKLLLQYGVDKEDIWVEKKTSSTSDQIEYIKENLSKKKNLGRIIIISDHFHLKRVMENCRFFNVKAIPIASDLQLSWEKSIYFRFRESMALLVFWFFAL
ncbi:MAG: YdcF family protein [Syntrophothermus sp.]